ncbi:MAG: M23 family metallopeptidase [Clostridia bacterium]
MNKFAMAMKKFGGFMKKNAFYFLIVLCIASVATTVALAVTNNLNVGDKDIIIKDDPGADVGKPDDGGDVVDKPEEPVIPQQTFIAPANGAISHEYNMDGLFNQTLCEMSTHNGIDFVSEDLNIFATCSGVVKEIGSNMLDGNYIILTHENGYESCYYSLEKATDLKVGAKVAQGQNLGKMSISQGVESLDGNHLHFEMFKNGEQINPLDVLILEEK